VPGDGVALATNIYRNSPSLQPHLVRPAVAPEIGSTPSNFIKNAAGYQLADIVSLIVFYNEDFGVLEGDDIPQCVDKFHRFLTTY
jgi:hypothetical protein